METELLIPSPDIKNLVRLLDQHISSVVKLTNDAIVQPSSDKITAHISAKKIKELFEQIKPLIQ